MKVLGSFPAVRLIEGKDTSLEASAGFADAPIATWRDAAQVARDCAAESGAKAVVLVEPNVNVDKKAEVLAVDPFACDADVSLRFPARSLVTGLHLPRGLVLVPVDQISNVKRDFDAPVLTVPSTIGTFSGNKTPELAFETAFGIARRYSAEASIAPNQLALSASLGTDALNGCWWVLGSLAGLQEQEELGKAWERHEALLSVPGEIGRHIAGEARRVRLRTGLPVGALTQAQSRAMKAMLSPWPPADIWRKYISAVEAFGTGGKGTAERYRQAARYIWP